MEFKYAELITISSIVDVQIVTIEETLKVTTNDLEIKTFKSELTKLKSIRTKMKKYISDY